MGAEGVKGTGQDKVAGDRGGRLHCLPVYLFLLLRCVYKVFPKKCVCCFGLQLVAHER
jgi:hypothetical protein